jgi:hypothetical protein
MSLWRLFRLLFGCPHHLVRERVDGVMSFVCTDCHHTQPIVDRTAAEHRRVRKVGAVQLPKAQSSTPKVASINGRRRTK